MGVLHAVVLLAASTAAFPSVAGIFRRDDSLTPDSAQTNHDTQAAGWTFITTTFVQTDLQTVTQTISSYMSDSSTSSLVCDYSKGQTICGSVCCNSDQYCASIGECAPIALPCQNPCGWDGTLCCASNEVCITDANNQAQCHAASPGSGSTCGLSTTVYTTTQSYESTVLETVTLVVTRVEKGVEVVTRTASFAVSAICVPALGQVQCGSICCPGGQVCQAPGTCLQSACFPNRPTSDTLGSGYMVTTTASTAALPQPPLRPTTDSFVTNGVGSGSLTTASTFVSPVTTG